MRTFECVCENDLFFHNRTCLNCGRKTGFCPQCRLLVAVNEDAGDNRFCSHCETQVESCHNADQFDVCNQLTLVTADSNANGHEHNGGLCRYCLLTKTIPNLNSPGQLEKWRTLEEAKARSLYVMELLGFPLKPGNTGVRLSFHFKADGFKRVFTGHMNGEITINTKEADSVQREIARVSFGEPQRTLVGHFRHELGHYIWDRLIKGKREGTYRDIFGDERSPNYAQALVQYGNSGPKPNWQSNFISAYATMHSWEDFAETFGAYLDMVSVLLTADHFDFIKTDTNDLDQMVDNYRRVGVISNELNRDMGLLDLVPEIIEAPVREKLRFVHDLRLAGPKESQQPTQ